MQIKCNFFFFRAFSFEKLETGNCKNCKRFYVSNNMRVVCTFPCCFSLSASRPLSAALPTRPPQHTHQPASTNNITNAFSKVSQSFTPRLFMLVSTTHTAVRPLSSSSSSVVLCLASSARLCIERLLLSVGGVPVLLGTDSVCTCVLSASSLCCSLYM